MIELHIVPPHPEADVCDFCESPDVVTVFRCHPSVTDVKHVPRAKQYSDDGEWAACAVCAALVRANRREDLRNHSIHCGDANDQAFRLFVAELHGIFWANYIGEMKTEL